MKRLVSLLLCALLLVLVAAPSIAAAEDLPKDVTVRVYS